MPNKKFINGTWVDDSEVTINLETAPDRTPNKETTAEHWKTPMDEFDYLQENALMNFTLQFEPKVSTETGYTGNIGDYTKFIEQEFLPRYERAIYLNQVEKRSISFLQHTPDTLNTSK
jgi:hypothetical protein